MNTKCVQKIKSLGAKEREIFEREVADARTDVRAEKPRYRRSSAPEKV